jgi:hypothetical protein
VVDGGGSVVDGGGVDNGNVLMAVAVAVTVVVAVTVAVMVVVVSVAVAVMVMAVVTVAVEEVVKNSVVAHVCRVVGLQFTIFKRSQPNLSK